MNEIIRCDGCGAKDNLNKNTHVECAYCGNHLKVKSTEPIKHIAEAVWNTPVKTIHMGSKRKTFGFGSVHMHALLE